MNTKEQKYMIIKDRVEIYKDFALNLLYYIHHYYLDRESLSSENDIKNHYSWCFNKVCDEFKKESIDFGDNNDLRDYYYSYYYNQLYNSDLDIPLATHEKFFENIFNIDKQINKNFLNILIEVYIIYDKSINKEKDVLVAI